MKRKISIAKSFKKDIAKQVIHLATAEWAEVLNCLVQKKELPEKYQKDSKLICKALIEFYDAVADKNYEKAAKVARELGTKADVERVKSFEKTARHFAEVVGIEIFGKDYEAEEKVVPYNDPDSDPCVAFKYKDGSSFVLYYTDAFEGGIVGSPNSAK